MYGITDLKKDTLIQIAGVPYRIVESQHTKVARGGAIVRTKLKNLLDGTIKQETFKGSDKLEPARVDKVDMQFLYREGSELVLMDLKSYEQSQIEAATVGESARFLAEGSNVVALVFNGKLIGVDVPAKIDLQVAETEPGVQGDTAKAALKPAKLENGVSVQVPLFVKIGDRVRVDTRNGSYVERAN